MKVREQHRNGLLFMQPKKAGFIVICNWWTFMSFVTDEQNNYNEYMFVQAVSYETYLLSSINEQYYNIIILQYTHRHSSYNLVINSCTLTEHCRRKSALTQPKLMSFCHTLSSCHCALWHWMCLTDVSLYTNVRSSVCHQNRLLHQLQHKQH